MKKNNPILHWENNRRPRFPERPTAATMCSQMNFLFESSSICNVAVLQQHCLPCLPAAKQPAPGFLKLGQSYIWRTTRKARKTLVCRAQAPLYRSLLEDCAVHVLKSASLSSPIATHIPACGSLG